MITKSKIRKDDTVQVLAGKDKGKRGTIVRIIPKKVMPLIIPATVIFTFASLTSNAVILG